MKEGIFMSAATSAALPVGGSIISVILPMLLGLIIHFIPSGLAFIKRNSNFRRIFMLNLIPWVINFIVNIIVLILSGIWSEIEFLAIIILVLEVIWGIICIIIWIIALVKAIRGY